MIKNPATVLVSEVTVEISGKNGSLNDFWEFVEPKMGVFYINL